MDTNKKIYPKCLNKKAHYIAVSATQKLLPCCWLDINEGWKDPKIKPLFDEKLNLKDNEIEDIIKSKTWQDFIKMLKENKDVPMICKRMCSSPLLDQNVNRKKEHHHLTIPKPNKIKICTLYFEGKYTPDYVEKLYNSLKRNCTIPFEFICYSDNPNVKADVVIPLKPHSDIVKHWYKLSYFSPLFANQKPEDEIIIMDIDQVIVNNIDDMIGWPVADNELVSYNKWWGGKPTYGLKLNGGFLKFKSGSCQVIWDTFIEAPEDWQLNYYKQGIVHYKYYGEQNYINWMCDKNKINLTLMPPEWVCKLTNDEEEDRYNNFQYMKKFNKDYMILDKPNDDIKVIHFANPNADIHTSKYKWIKDYWK